MLFNIERHEKLRVKNYNNDDINVFCSELIDETIKRFHEETLWPIHKLDLEKDEEAKEYGFKDLYFGSSGILWLMHQLNQKINYKEVINRSLELYLCQRSDEERKEASSLFFGEVGIRLMKNKFDPSLENTSKLYDLIHTHIDNPFNEVLYGNQGTLIAAFEMLKSTKDDRFKQLFQETKDAIFKSWKWNDDFKCFLWAQNFGEELTFIGAAHGTFGNIQALMYCKDLLSSDEVNLINNRTKELLIELSLCSNDGDVNWRARVDSEKTPLLHWCHGSPGIICSVSHFLPRDKEVDELLLRAGETIWKAGPLKKGTSLCHGTSGNSFAFLKLYERFKDEIWIERASKFLAHSIEQSKEMRKEFGDYRYSLWTGDLGIVWLNHCLKRNHASLPILDII